ncbi:tellurite resistance protein TehB [bacterium BMS3Abin03]|nr:tellurite resistance protein TehB [bacterium BMS3Abin03]
MTMNNFGSSFWDERYSTKEFVYGNDPNTFFKNELDKLTPGKIIMLGEGEGRNAVYAATREWKVDAVDFSPVAKEKALRAAKEKSVTINYKVSDLSDYEPKKNYYDAAAIIFLHLNPGLRKWVHPRVIDSLKSGGTLILEVFEKEQLEKSSGGPKNINMLYSKEELERDFKKMEISLIEKRVVDLKESKHHEGEAVVLRLIAVKP